MSIFQKSATISFSDSIIYTTLQLERTDFYQSNEMLRGVEKTTQEAEGLLFDESFADVFLMCSFVEAEECNNNNNRISKLIEERLKSENDVLKAQLLRNFLFLRLRRLLPHEYERLFGQEKSKFSMPIPFRNPVVLKKPAASLKLVQFTRRSIFSFEPKQLARHLAIAEAFLFVQIDERELLKGSDQENSTGCLIERYNRLTRILISATLECENQVKAAQFILKMTREFHELGILNGFKACLAALQSASLHRLHLEEDLPSKYQKRLQAFAQLAQPKDNFALMRQTQCLVPWLGMLLKDVEFISEFVKLKGDAGGVGGSLSKIFNSIADSRNSCTEWLQRNQQMLPKAGKILEWLDETPILYSTEKQQYAQSKAIKP